MDVTLITRSNTIESAIQKRLQVKSDEYLMLFFDSGYRFIESGLLARDTVKSNLFWFWWANRFMSTCEAFLLTNQFSKSVLKDMLSHVPQPSEKLLEKINYELKMKQKHGTN